MMQSRQKCRVNYRQEVALFAGVRRTSGTVVRIFWWLGECSTPIASIVLYNSAPIKELRYLTIPLSKVTFLRCYKMAVKRLKTRFRSPAMPIPCCLLLKIERCWALMLFQCKRWCQPVIYASSSSSTHILASLALCDGVSFCAHVFAWS